MSMPFAARWPGWSIGLAALLLAAPGPRSASAQPPQAAAQVNPRAGDRGAIEQGMHLFRNRCAGCHGMDAKGYRGSDLTNNDWVHGGSDAQILRSITRGLPGTEMPAANMSEDEAWQVIAYLRTLAAPESAAALRGDAGRGESLFWARDRGNCGQCHMVNGRGGRLGPTLSRIGAARSVAALEREIRRPSEIVPVGFETVTVVMRDGTRLRGARRNEDTFSVQIMTPNEEVRSFLKRDVAEVVEDRTSLMPAYGSERLSEAQLDDLIRYLKTLRGSTPPSQP